MVCLNPVTLKFGWKDTNEFCKKYADEVYKKIPKNSCDKNKLLSIILSCDISSSDEAVAILEGKIEYRDNLASSSEGLEAFAFEAHANYISIYQSMINSIKKYCK
jgi:hypothetical protein